MNSLVIALFHAVPIAVIGLVTKNRSALNWVTGIMCVIAVVSGNSSFLIDDLLVIAIAYVLIAQVTNNVDKQKNSNTTTIQKKQESTHRIKEYHEAKQWKTSRETKQAIITNSTTTKTAQTSERRAREYKRSILHLNRNIGDSDTCISQDTNLKIGDKVRHRTRLDVGVGVILEIMNNGTCTVEFPNSKFSGIPLKVIGTIDQVENEKRVREAEEQKQQTLLAQQRILREKQLEVSEKRKSAEEQKLRKKILEAHLIALERKRNHIKAKFSQHDISCLWHISHRDNIASILEHGILNHYDAHRLNINRVDISDPGAQRWREGVEEHHGRKIHDYAPLYINPRNPMLYVRQHLQNKLCLIEVSLSALSEAEYLISDGNAASRDTKFHNSVDLLDFLPWDVLNAGYWADLPDGKRKRCAEVLIYPKVEPKHLGAIHCYSSETLNYLANCGRKLELSRNYFF